MEVRREVGVSKCESSDSFSEIEKYIRKIIDIFAASELPREQWLTEREKTFFISCVIHLNNGITNPICESAVQIYKKYHDNKVTKKQINNYLTLVGDKFWLKYDKDGKHVKVPELFMMIGREKDSFEFKINMSYETDRSVSN